MILSPCSVVYTLLEPEGERDICDFTSNWGGMPDIWVNVTLFLNTPLRILMPRTPDHTLADMRIYFLSKMRNLILIFEFEYRTLFRSPRGEQFNKAIRAQNVHHEIPTCSQKPNVYKNSRMEKRALFLSLVILWVCVSCAQENECLLWSQLFPAIICFETRSSTCFQAHSNSLKWGEWELK